MQLAYYIDQTCAKFTCRCTISFTPCTLCS